MRGERRPGRPYFRSDVSNIRYAVDSTTRPGLVDSTGGLIITPNSSPTAAIVAAMERWSRAPGAVVRFAAPIPTERSVRFDDLNVISFADTPSVRALVGDAVAVTRLGSESSGALTDTDIVFNPDLVYSTTLTAGTFDIEGTLVHELGHALGLSHSGVVTSSLFASTFRATARLRTPTQDDLAFTVEAYPGGGSNLFATLEGRVTFQTGLAARRALVTAIDPDRNSVVGGLTSATGDYLIAGAPPGNYLVYAEPLDGPTELPELGLSGPSDTSFRTGFFGGATPRRVRLLGGSIARADFSVNTGAPALNIERIGIALPGGIPPTRLGGVVRGGQVYDIQISGLGVDRPELTEEAFEFHGSGVTLVPGSAELVATSSGTRLDAQIQVAANAPTGLVSLGLRMGDELSIFSGGIEIVSPPPPPNFGFRNVVNAASFQGGAVSPGEIITIFGTDVGPPGSHFGFIDPIDGTLATQLEGVSVFFNGVPAPIFFVNETQINAQVPFTESSGGITFTTVMRDSQSSNAVALNVRDATPALFTRGGNQIAALNSNLSINNAATPARRGDTVALFGTGQGSVAPALATGALAGGLFDLSFVEAQVAATIGGQAAVVSFAGMAPGLVGLLQVNVEIPATVPPGPAEVRIQVGGTLTQPGVTIAVQ